LRTLVAYLQEVIANAIAGLRPEVGLLGTHSPRPVSLHPIKYSQSALNVYPKISIVVPCLNHGRFIEATLNSIINQCYPNLELIVVDGGSTDNTLTVIRQYETYITRWVSEPDSGQVNAINKGFKQSTGDIMAWINSDDIVAAGAFHFVADYFIKNSLTQAVYGDRILINEDGLEIGRWILPRHSDRTLKFVDFIPQETLYWTRSAWRLVGDNLDETFHFAMDWDFLLRLSRSGIKICHVPIFLGLFRVHPQQKTSSQMSSIGEQEIYKIRYRELGFQPTQRQLILNTLPFFLAAKLREIYFRYYLEKRVCV
jgi:glycosyltransferase involved in cell wall biosynthesis